MDWIRDEIQVKTNGKGLYPFTEQIQAILRKHSVRDGLCVLYIPHTSASLLINENYDPSVQMDLETFLEKLIPEMQPWMKHRLEGSDDSSSHLKSALLPVEISIPIDDGQLSLGTWQGVFLAEHRTTPHLRQVSVRIMKFD
jgi:secondary thiamine-phosphate synthase enzyme